MAWLSSFGTLGEILSFLILILEVILLVGIALEHGINYFVSNQIVQYLLFNLILLDVFVVLVWLM
jgi:hypothetical protein